MKKYFWLVSISFMIQVACEDSAPKLCDELQADIVAFNIEEVKGTLNPWLSGNLPIPTAEDPIGHQQNLQNFVDRLNDDCGLDASIVCYACIETYPVQSEVRVMVDSSGISVARVLDIVTPGIDPYLLTSAIMEIRNIHF
jgi:hypothetical protein